MRLSDYCSVLCAVLRCQAEKMAKNTASRARVIVTAYLLLVTGGAAQKVSDGESLFLARLLFFQKSLRASAIKFHPGLWVNLCLWLGDSRKFDSFTEDIMYFAV